MEVLEKKSVDLMTKELFKFIKSLSYGYSDFKGQLHENQFKLILDDIGFGDVSEIYTKDAKTKRKIDPRLTKLKSKLTPGDDISEMGFENGTYIYQPYGIHGSPDFILFLNNAYLMIELKSNKKDKIEWNTHVPQYNWIYVFSSENLGDTTYLMGQDIMSIEVREAWKILNKLFKGEFREKINMILNIPENIHNVKCYPRQMMIVPEPVIRCEYRKERERYVSIFIKNIIRSHTL